MAKDQEEVWRGLERKGEEKDMSGREEGWNQMIVRLTGHVFNHGLTLSYAAKRQ